MTRNIVDIIKEQTMNPPTPVVPTEKAQINVLFSNNTNLIFRFATTKKAEKEFKALKVAWRQRSEDNQMHDVDSDMFISTIDLYPIVSISYVDIAKRSKFIPYQG